MSDHHDSLKRERPAEPIEDTGTTTAMVRQGDVLLVLLERLPANAVETSASDRGVVAARSWATGHAHLLTGTRLRRFAAHGTTIVEVTGSAVLTHDEHDPLDLPPGTWEIRLQRQYDPMSLRPELGLD